MSRHRADAPVKIEELEGVFYHVACIIGCEFNCKAEDQHVVFVTSSFEGPESLAKARVVREIVNNYSRAYGELDIDVMVNYLLKFNMEKLRQLRDCSGQVADSVVMLNSI